MKNLEINPHLYEEAEEILASLHLPMDTAVNMFLRQVVLHRGLPFPVVLPDDTVRNTADVPQETESFGWMGELFEDLLRETEAVKAECDTDE